MVDMTSFALGGSCEVEGAASKRRLLKEEGVFFE
tara:strand:- start:1097 stop:1198 length:102 start_codon:yes stop_codon:yes gene_type:complete